MFQGVPAQVPAGPDASARGALAVLHEVASDADADGDARGAQVLREAAAVLAGRTGAFVAAPGVRARCFGSYGLVVGDRAVALGDLRPRARAMLRLLSVHAGRPVHRETLLAALWPDAAPHAASRSMLTTVSSVRSLLASSPAAGALKRDGHTYALDAVLLTTDVHLADGLLRNARLVRSTDPSASARDAAAALELYQGELLSEEGPAEWVVDLREHWRQRMAGAAHDLAVLRYRAGDPAGATAAARQGLTIDRMSDPLWRVLVAALRANEDPAAAERAAAEYDALLTGLAS